MTKNVSFFCSFSKKTWIVRYLSIERCESSWCKTNNDHVFFRNFIFYFDRCAYFCTCLVFLWLHKHQRAFRFFVLFGKEQKSAFRAFSEHFFVFRTKSVLKASFRTYDHLFILKNVLWLRTKRCFWERKNTF